MKRISTGRRKRSLVRERNGNLHVEVRALVRAAQRAVREALRQHKRAGNPVAGIVDGKVVLIPPSRIKA